MVTSKIGHESTEALYNLAVSEAVKFTISDDEALLLKPESRKKENRASPSKP